MKSLSLWEDKKSSQIRLLKIRLNTKAKDLVKTNYFIKEEL